jgi:hypothetical protein
MRSIADQVDAVLFTGSSSGNLLINGAMQVAQRSSSVASITTSNYYTADRFQFLINTLGTWTQTIENDAPTGSGFRKSIKNLCTVIDTPAAGDYCITEQVLEGQNLQAIRKGTASAQSVVLSFWVKANKTGTYICQLRDDDNSRSVSKSYSITTASTWQYVSLVFPADTTGVFDNNNAGSLRVRWWLAAGSTYTSGTLNTAWEAEVVANVAAGQVNLADTVNNFWQMTGAQLTVGAVATPFEFKSFADDFRYCQRYYQRIAFDSDSSFANIAVGMVTSASVLYMTVPLQVVLRVVPSSIGFSAAGTFFVDVVTGGAQATSIAANAGRSSKTAIALDVAKAGMTAGQAGVLLQYAGSTTFIDASAEL